MGNRCQRQIRRAFIAKPGARLTTMDLVRKCYPRLSDPVCNKHRFAVRRAAERIAVKVGRTYPGGFIWVQKPSQPLHELERKALARNFKQSREDSLIVGAFLAHPGCTFCTADLMRWAYPQIVGELRHHHRQAVLRVAARVAKRVGRIKPGGIVWAAK